MPRLGNHDARRIRSLSEALTAEGQGTDRLALAVRTVADLVGSPVVAYGLNDEESGYSVAFATVAGIPTPNDRSLRAWNRALGFGRQVGLYTPSHPEPGQRNRTVEVPSVRQIYLPVADGRARGTNEPERSGELLKQAEGQAWITAFDELGVGTQRQLRVLVCDREVFMAWFGIFGTELRSRDRLVLSGVLPALHRHFQSERDARRFHGFARAGQVQLDELGAEAFFVFSGKIEAANPLGAFSLRTRGDETRREVLDAVRGGHSRFKAHLLSTEGSRRTHLVVCAVSPCGAYELIGRARRRWGLTARQGEVLVRLAEGETNKRIAEQLRCAQRTVAIHVSALLNKMQAGNRSSLVKKFWTELSDDWPRPPDRRSQCLVRNRQPEGLY